MAGNNNLSGLGQWAWILALVGGVLVFLSGILTYLAFSSATYFGFGLGAFSFYFMIGAILGLLVAIAGFMLKSAQNKQLWGILAIIFSLAAAYFGGGGIYSFGYVGILLGLAGGALAFISK